MQELTMEQVLGKKPVMSKKRVRYSFLTIKPNGDVYAIVIPKQRRGCPCDLVITIGKVRTGISQKRKRSK